MTSKSLKQLLLLLLYCLLGASSPAYVSAFTYRQCINDIGCDSNSYCYKPPPDVSVAERSFVSQFRGQCLQCWSCCMFPAKFGAQCSLKCKCSAPNSSSCAADATTKCGWGEYCNAETCKSCLHKTADNGVSCVNRETHDPKVAFLDYYTFHIIKSRPGVEITKNEIINWLNRQRISSELIFNRINNTFQDLDEYHYFDVADVLYNLGQSNNVCPSGARVTLPNCPCNLKDDANDYICPAGTACSKSPYNGLSYMMYDDPILHSLRAMCILCRPGDFCPQGTVLNDESASNFEKLKCPSGYFCPTADKRFTCKNGSFCDRGFTEQLTCNYTELLRTKGYIPKRPDTVVERIFKYNDPYVGNTCLQNASTPDASCPKGFYCPTPAVRVICPAGYFCKSQAISPVKCPVLSSCPEGSFDPDPVVTPYLFSSLIILTIMCTYIVRHIYHYRKNSAKKKAEDKQYSAVENKIGQLSILLPKSPDDEVTLRQQFSKFSKKKIHTPAHIYKTICDSVLADSSVVASILPVPEAGAIAQAVTLTETSEVEIKDWNSMTVIPIEKLELRNVSAPWLCSNTAHFLPCKLNVIIGGSGCGKSTFLDLLRGNISSGKLTGQVNIKLKNQPVVSMDLPGIEKHQEWTTYNKLKAVRGYVPQDDVLYGDLTVRENLKYSALLKLNMHCDKTHVDAIVDYVLKKLCIDHIADRIVGTVERRGISGGQRKRVNIGMEIVTFPSLLIMDEPTSGLDANGCQKLIEFCSVLTDMNITIISVIHQPRYTSFILFDQITMLSKYGTIFEGPATSSLLYFTQGLSMSIDKNENPADVLMDILSGGTRFTPQRLVEMWRTNGKTWLEEAAQVYPLHHDILDHGVVYDSRTRSVLDKLLSNNDVNVSSDYISSLFKMLCIPASLPDVKEFVSRYGEENSITKQEFLRVFQEKCASAALSGTFENVIDRIRLFKSLPVSVVQDKSEAEYARYLYIAHKFGKRLMKKVRGNAARILFKQTVNPAPLADEILLASMTCKSIYKYMYAEKNEVLRLPELQLIKQAKGHSKIPRCLTNTWDIFKRKMLMIFRSPWPIQMLIPITAAFIIGRIHGYSAALSSYPNNVVAAMVCMGVLSMITHVRTFSLDKVIIRREIEGNIGLFPFIVSYNVADLVWVFMIPVLFVTPYYYLTFPLTPYRDFLGVAFMICWLTSGCAYVISSLPLAMHWVNLIAVFVSVIFGAFLQGLDPTIHTSKGTFQGFLIHLSYNRWSMEALSITEFSAHDSNRANIVWGTMDKIGLCGLKGDLFEEIDINRPSLKRLFDLNALLTSQVEDQCSGYVTNAYLWLFGYGCIYRIIAIVVLYYNVHPIWSRFHWFLLNLPGLLLRNIRLYVLKHLKKQ